MLNHVQERMHHQCRWGIAPGTNFQRAATEARQTGVGHSLPNRSLLDNPASLNIGHGLIPILPLLGYFFAPPPFRHCEAWVQTFLVRPFDVEATCHRVTSKP